MRKHRTCRWKEICASVTASALAIVAAHTAAAQGRTCQRVELKGEVGAGQEWRTSLGQGWVFRLLPIAPSTEYSGWDLAIDHDPPSGYPDALLVATPPYNSINQREIGTTFGLRAQDALGWNPRSFHFLTNPADFRQAQQWMGQLASQVSNTSSGVAKADIEKLTQQLLSLEKNASSGQLRIVDARLVPGIADPQPFAQSWALAFSRTQYHVEPVAAGNASPLGKLAWMRFAVTLWLPSGWKVPPGIKPVREPCPE